MSSTKSCVRTLSHCFLLTLTVYSSWWPGCSFAHLRNSRCGFFSPRHEVCDNLPKKAYRSEAYHWWFGSVRNNKVCLNCSKTSDEQASHCTPNASHIAPSMYSELAAPRRHGQWDIAQTCNEGNKKSNSPAVVDSSFLNPVVHWLKWHWPC